MGQHTLLPGSTGNSSGTRQLEPSGLGGGRAGGKRGGGVQGPEREGLVQGQSPCLFTHSLFSFFNTEPS